ncbi:MAG: mitochondrial fission ELM1 family protein [Candidatus Omnitrophica bacterium]|nr:mitochondrial fission ELM1 family protein [Candidatus Omnitrophota bacterium]MBU1869984.1 mitochondrial fission ELM1 family protein [Candidatus Omnitrophota bacterium]
MKKDFLIDYSSYILFRAVAFIIGFLPIRVGLFLGERIGDLLYALDVKHKAIVYANLKVAFGKSRSPSQLKKLARGFYRNFGQSLVEIFFIPFADEKYIKKYVSFEGYGHIDEAFKKGRGVILLGVHAGSWELSNIICASLGFPFNLIVREQKFSRLNKLLNSYRRKKGCKLLERENQTRQLIQVLKNNESIGLTCDQGGRSGTIVKFFGKDASMASGAVRLALKYGAVILPAYYTRVKGPYIKTIIDAPFEVSQTGDLEKDIWDNLQRLTRIFERKVEAFPRDYLWSYKTWKYGAGRNILILSDAKAGHLRQSQAAAKIAAGLFQDNGARVNIETVEVRFKSKLASRALSASSCLSGKYSCQGCLWCLRSFLEPQAYQKLVSMNPDMIISCGSSLAPINYVLTRENLAKSVVIMKPSFLSMKRFDLVVMPWHDKPPKRKNVAVIEGALNLIEEEYVKEQAERLEKSWVNKSKVTGSQVSIGVLIGGNTKNFSLTKKTMSEVINQIKLSAERLDADILLTTSRRTSKEVEDLIKKELANYSRCRFLIIANEKNIPEAVGGILGLSSIVVSSPESISMISEASSSNRYVVVFDAPGLRAKHRSFIKHFSDKRHICLSDPDDLKTTIEDLWQNKPEIVPLKDSLVVNQALRRIV